jgi:type I restriction enzyme S subunit
MNWPTKKLGEICDFIFGFAFRASDFNTESKGLPVIRIGDIDKGSTEKFYDGSYDDRYLVHKGDILIGLSGSIKIAKWLGGKSLLNQRVVKLINFQQKIFPDFIYYQISILLGELEEKISKLTVKNVLVPHLKNLEIPLPPLEIQKQIVARIEELFEKIDKAKELRRKAQEETSQIFSSTSQKIFKEAEKNWGLETLENICLEITDGTHYTPKYKSEGVPFLSVRNVKEDGFDLSEVKYISPDEHNKLIKRCKPEKGDIIYTKVGTIGIAQVNTLNFEFSIFVSLALLKLKKDLVLPKYIEYILNSPSVRNQAYSRTQGAANQNLVIRDIKPIKIPLPPISEQKKIVDYLDNLRDNTEKLRRLQEEQLEELEELKKSILDKAFKGELL